MCQKDDLESLAIHLNYLITIIPCSFIWIGWPLQGRALQQQAQE